MSAQQQRLELKTASEHLQLQLPFVEVVFDDSWETLWDCVIRICDRHFSSTWQQYAT
jgi:hypothetical protein